MLWLLREMIKSWAGALIVNDECGKSGGAESTETFIKYFSGS